MVNEPKNDNSQEQEIKYHVPSDLEYCYRDFVNVHIGAGDVVIEFGNVHRSNPGHIFINNRVVMTVAGAYQLNQTLQKALQAAQDKLQTDLQNKTP
jgi:hypothetical protein